jgi:23S rRNA (adenine2030-N6)-methyltransferase
MPKAVADAGFPARKAMNYRHAFHAGNAADVFKHVMLTRILAYLLKKETAIRYIDTHAGIGRYKLDGAEAERTGEARNGVLRLLREEPPAPLKALVEPYLALLSDPETYPGSPAIAAGMLRAQDRLSLAELHPQDHGILRKLFIRDRRIKTFHDDGYRVLNAAVPPPERRGLVLMDPPFERADDFLLLRDSLAKALAKWPTGIYAVWYPLKDLDLVERFVAAMQAMKLAKLIDITLWQDRLHERPGLPGSGLLVINPPFGLAEDAQTLLPWLAGLLATGEPSWTLRVLADA